MNRGSLLRGRGRSIVVHVFILPPNALRRDCNGKCIELIEGHALEVVVEVYLNILKSIGGKQHSTSTTTFK